MAASIVPVNRQNVRSEGKQRIESRLMADSSSESGGDQFLRDDINWSDRPREIVDHAASRCNLPLKTVCLPVGVFWQQNTHIQEFTHHHVQKIFVSNGRPAKFSKEKSYGYLLSPKREEAQVRCPDAFPIHRRNGRS